MMLAHRVMSFENVLEVRRSHSSMRHIRHSLCEVLLTVLPVPTRAFHPRCGTTGFNVSETVGHAEWVKANRGVILCQGETSSSIDCQLLRS